MLRICQYKYAYYFLYSIFGSGKVLLMIQERGLFGLNMTILVTSVLVFGVIAGILGVILLYAGVTGEGAILLWLIISFLMIFLQWYFGPALIRFVTGAREVKPEEAPKLHAMLDRLSSEAGIPKPKLYVVNNRTPNAFAFGRTQGSSGIAVHTGLLEVLNEDEVEAVLAHEVGHIKHRDVLVMTVASSLPVMLYYAVLIFGGGNDRERGLGSIMLTFIGAIIAQLIGQLMVMWLSRRREYYADAFAAYATRKPELLMSALAKITYKAGPEPAASGLSSLYIADPSPPEKEKVAEIARALGTGNPALIESAIQNEVQKAGVFEMFMTHPLTAKRLAALWEIKKENEFAA